MITMRRRRAGERRYASRRSWWAGTGLCASRRSWQVGTPQRILAGWEPHVRLSEYWQAGKAEAGSGRGPGGYWAGEEASAGFWGRWGRWSVRPGPDSRFAAHARPGGETIPGEPLATGPRHEAVGDPGGPPRQPAGRAV